MLRRLEHRLPLLTGGPRDLPARQQALRSTIAWSHDLLSGDEQQLYRRLTVFVGGCTLEAAEAVCRPESGPTVDVLEGVAALVDKSLLRQVEGIDGETRIEMLGTIREFGQEQLERSGEVGALRRRHAEYFRALVEEADLHLRGPGAAAWLDRLDAEHDNLRAALAWSLEMGEAALGLGMAGILAWFWRLRGHLREGRRWLEAVVAAGQAVRTTLRVRALNGLGILSYNHGDTAIPVLEESLALARELGDQSGMAWALYTIGRAAYARGEYERSRTLVQDSLTIFRALDDVVGCSYACWYLGIAASKLLEYPRASAFFEESIALARQAGDTWALASALLNSADHAYYLRQFDRALALLKREPGALRNASRRLGHVHRSGCDGGGGRGAGAIRASGPPVRGGGSPAHRDRVGHRRQSAHGAGARRPCVARWAKKPAPLSGRRVER